MPLFEPVDNLTKLYVPLWWYGQVDKLDDHSPTHCDLTCSSNAKFGKYGYVLGGVDGCLIDADGRKVLSEGTSGEWSSLFLTDGDVPKRGSIQGTGTKLYLNIAGTAPKITGKIILHPRYCSNLVYFRCHNNSISVLDVSALTLLTSLYCSNNSISVLDVSALTLLTILICRTNSISVLDVSALTLLTNLACYSNSMNQAMVDTVLCDMDGHGTSNGVLNISNNAAPSATGITCKNNLIARGWTVTTD